MSTGPDIAAIHRRICRLHGSTWADALLYVGVDGSWHVIRAGTEPQRCQRFEDAGMFVGSYTSSVGFDQLSDDVGAHLHELRS